MTNNKQTTNTICSLAFDNPNHHNNHHHHSHGGNIPRPPRIKEHPNSLVVKKHEPVTLSCKADGDPEPVIDWYRDNELVKKSPNHIYLNNGDLFILKVMNYRKEKDTGVYYCLARNINGKARSHNATIEIATIRDDFRILPKNVFANVGEMAIMECSPPRGYPEPTIRWRKDDQLLSINNNNNNGGRYRLSGTNLQINNVQPEDNGSYQCLAQNMAGQRESLPAQLNVRGLFFLQVFASICNFFLLRYLFKLFLVKPHFIIKPEDITALANEIAEIHCKVGGDPIPNVSWRREGGQISSQRASINENNSLRIVNVTEEDEGLYICQAENLVDRISHSATLIVHSKPTFLIEPNDVRVTINSMARFDCIASGNPRPSVFWNKEGNQFLMFPDNKYERFMVTPEGSLIISPVKKEDKGYYVCSALSVVSSARTKAYLNISSSIDLPPPIIVLGPADQTLPEHTTAMLPCDVIGQPVPTLKWFFNNSPLPVNNVARFSQLDSGTLQIDDLQLSDSGEYKCLAYSENGEASWSAKLLVASPHSTNTMFHRMPDPATFPDAPSRPNILNVTENSITIQWIRSGRDGSSPFKGIIIEYFSPDHHNEWIKAAKGIQSDHFTITGLKSGSRYYFIVRSENNHGIGPPSPISYEARTLGSIQISTTTVDMVNNNNHHNMLTTKMLDMNDIRKKLENTIIELKDVRTISSSAVKLFWNIHSNGNHDYIEGFYIRYRKIDPNQEYNHNNNNYNHHHNHNHHRENYSENKYQMHTVYNGGASSYIINNLPKYTTFEFFLVPFFKSIDGRPSNSRIVRTLEGVPSASPTLIQARPISSDSALITWQPPPLQEMNGLLLGYIIFVHGTYTGYNINLTVNSNTTSYLLRNLTSETEYVIQITAFTSVGVGVPSAPLTFIMDPLMMSNDIIYNEHNQTGIFDSSNVWICVLIISLIILSLIVLLLGFLLFKKRSAIMKKNNENSMLNRELKSTQNDHLFCSRPFDFPKGWQQNDIKQQQLQQQHSSGTMIKLSPTLIPTDNNGYSTVTTDDQAADYADYDYVSQQGENNYESTTYEPYPSITTTTTNNNNNNNNNDDDGPIAYASSSIVINNNNVNNNNTNNNPYRLNNQTINNGNQQPMQWRTQLLNTKNDNHMKPLNFAATLDRNTLMLQNNNNNQNVIENRYGKKNLFINEIGILGGGVGGGSGKNINITEPLIGSHHGHHLHQQYHPIDNNDNVNHYHYADSAAYCSSIGGNIIGQQQQPSPSLTNNVTQIPSSKLMANQVKYGSLSRINKQQQQQQYHYEIKNGSNNNFQQNDNNQKSKPPPTSSSFILTSSNDSITRIQSPKTTTTIQQKNQFESYQSNKNRQHLIQNPLIMMNNTQPQQQSYEGRMMAKQSSFKNDHHSHNGNIYLSRNRANNDIKNIIDICDSESTYQELS
ncbi:protein sax-3-like isoform X4 [Dermatophagoides pteronyssinus]|uniref:protein sax-3-like isoform X4 n=1 Tax=Dermatophagoides pteronyssinus TaxID=6956 RepID=UPI003F663BC1